jgi:hypothetical protein
MLPKEGGRYGLQDFQSFNLAMLAKQISRLINDPDSLCAQFLKAKYYPDGDIMKAGPKAGCSFTWRSLLAGLTTFKRGTYGGLEAVIRLTFGRIRGYLLALMGRLLL